MKTLRVPGIIRSAGPAALPQTPESRFRFGLTGFPARRRPDAARAADPAVVVAARPGCRPGAQTPATACATLTPAIRTSGRASLIDPGYLTTLRRWLWQTSRCAEHAARNVLLANLNPKVQAPTR